MLPSSGDVERATIHHLVTIDDRSGSHALDTVGSRWTRALYDGPFHVPPLPSNSGLPGVSLVFVRSRDGNTGADEPHMSGDAFELVGEDPVQAVVLTCLDDDR